MNQNHEDAKIDPRTVPGGPQPPPMPPRQIILTEVRNGWIVRSGETYFAEDQQVFNTTDGLLNLVRSWADAAKFPRAVADPKRPLL